ncbi:hypothetical protein DFJ73DRAFT_898465 [Zopfochytrium polystomum]|nr:hypothetical protein DFJ73DRAFT_898465 [Zopfochytrium polystomum]
MLIDFVLLAGNARSTSAFSLAGCFTPRRKHEFVEPTLSLAKEQAWLHSQCVRLDKHTQGHTRAHARTHTHAHTRTAQRASTSSSRPSQRAPRRLLKGQPVGLVLNRRRQSLTARPRRCNECDASGWKEGSRGNTAVWRRGLAGEVGAALPRWRGPGARRRRRRRGVRPDDVGSGNTSTSQKCIPVARSPLVNEQIIGGNVPHQVNVIILDELPFGAAFANASFTSKRATNVARNNPHRPSCPRRTLHLMRLAVSQFAASNEPSKNYQFRSVDEAIGKLQQQYNSASWPALHTASADIPQLREARSAAATRRVVGSGGWAGVP